MSNPGPGTGAVPADHPTDRASGVHQVEPAPEARSYCTLPRIDYADSFTVDTGPGAERTAWDWARAVLEGAPVHEQRELRRAWTGLGLKLGPTGSDDHVLGWAVRSRTLTSVLVGADSRVGMPAELLFWTRPGSLLFATFVQQRNLAVRTLWAKVIPRHQAIVPVLLEQARRRYADAPTEP